MFFDDISDNLSLSGATPHTFSIINYSDKRVCVQGSIKISLCTQTKITIRLGKTNYHILGENLKLISLAPNSIEINGNIYGCYNDKFKN